MRFSRKISVILLALIALAFLYQNCSTKTLTKPPKTTAAAAGGTGGGNGDFYEGKPQPGNYYRTAPDSRCTEPVPVTTVIGAPLPVTTVTARILGTISVTETAVFISELDLDTCATNSRELTFEELEQSIYNRDYLGFAEGVYEKQEEPLDLLTVNESWCRVVKYELAADVVIKTDLLGLLPQATQYAAVRNPDGQTSTVLTPTTFSVNRNFANQVVAYSSGNFSLSIDTSQPLSPTGKRIGQLQTVVDGVSVSEQVECRSGGLLDPIL